MSENEALKTHEQVCSERYENICQRLDRGGQRMTRIEMLQISLFPWTIGLIVAAEFLR